MKSISTFVIALLVFSFFFLALPEKGISSITGGCCIKDGACAGCESGCITTPDFCIDMGGTEEEGACFDEGLGPPICRNPVDKVGCCVLGPDNCVEDIGVEDCFRVEMGDIWNPGDSCSEVPQCVVIKTPIPTISQWGLIALAGILGIVGFIMVMRRRKATV